MVGHIDEIERGAVHKILVTRDTPHIGGHRALQRVGMGVIEVQAFGQGHIQVHLLCVHGAGRGAPTTVGPVDARRSPQQVRQHRQRQGHGVEFALRLAPGQRLHQRQAATLPWRRQCQHGAAIARGGLGAQLPDQPQRHLGQRVHVHSFAEDHQPPSEHSTDSLPTRIAQACATGGWITRQGFQVKIASSPLSMSARSYYFHSIRRNAGRAYLPDLVENFSGAPGPVLRRGWPGHRRARCPGHPSARAPSASQCGARRW